MSYIRCGNHAHWGPFGAAGLLLTSTDRTQVLLQLRSPFVLNPNTWALPGGALECGETPTDAALREAREETGLTVHPTRTVPGLIHPRWSYTYVLATTETTTLPEHESWEASEHRWFPLDDTPPLHPDLARDWPRLLDELSRP